MKKLEIFVIFTKRNWLKKNFFLKHGVAKSVMFRNHPGIIHVTEANWNVKQQVAVRLRQNGALANSN